MLLKQTTPALIAICALSGLSGLPSFAADLTIASTQIGTRAAPAIKQQGRVESEKRRQYPLGEHSANKRESRNKSPAVKGASKQRQRKIIPSLFDGTRIKFRDEANINTPFAIPYRDRRLGTGLSDAGLMNSPSPQPKSPLNLLSGTGAKTEAANSTGITADCRGKTAPLTGAYRELTACYVQNHEKGWKTQTYLSKEFTDRSSSWGGGLAVGFAY